MKTPAVNQWRFTLRIIFPVLLVIILFVIAFYAIIVPTYERSMMDRKAEMIREMTNSAWSILHRYHQLEQLGLRSESDAKQEAVFTIEHLRYGPAFKDYFWITDLHPLMVMHPYRGDLNGQPLDDFRDPTGKALFVEMVDTVTRNSHGEGYVEYQWQYKDDSTEIVPKLSFVKLFKPWGWVVGTGIYLEDVKEEIATLEQGLLTIVLVITLVLAILLGVVAIQSYRIERRRIHAEEETRRSEERYRTLVEASSYGTMMILDGEVVYVNRVLQDLTGYSETEFIGRGYGIVFNKDHLTQFKHALDSVTLDSGKPATLELPLTKKEGEALQVQFSVSLMPLGNDQVHVVQCTPLSEEKRRIRLQENLNADLQTSVVLMSQPVAHLSPTWLACTLKQSIRHAAMVMTDKGYDAILILADEKEPIGIITDEDIRKRAVARDLALDEPVFQIMSSPLVTISERSMLYEAISLMQERGISHLGVRNREGNIISLISNRELLQVQQYAVSQIKQQIENAGTIQAVAAFGKRLPELTATLLNAGSDANHLLRFTALIFDSIVKKLISLILKELGDPPVPFSYVVLGSAGREEQTLATDQDNAIIFDDVPEARFESVQQYFLTLGSRISDGLAEAGFQYCPGKIMASNPDWCQPLGVWKKYFKKWITSAEPQDLLDLNIFFDLRQVYGEQSHISSLQKHIREVIQSHRSFFIFLAGNLMFKKQRGAIDIKKAMVPLVDIARLYALKEGITETGTLSRYARLFQLGVFTEEEWEERSEAYKILMLMRLKHQAAQFTMGHSMDNILHSDTLSEVEEAMMKKIFDQIAEFTGKVAMEFRNG
jgi:PAS domain S-box-containing protein